MVGDGANFVRTMAGLAERGAAPSVVDDQFGRLSFAADIAAGIRHLLETNAPYGTYNLSNDGPVQSWWEIAREVYRLRGADPELVAPVDTEAYFKAGTAPRPRNSALDLSKIRGVGYSPMDAGKRLTEYLQGPEV